MGKSRKRTKISRKKAEKSLYAIGIGSNQPLSRHLGPRAIVRAAIRALDEKPLKVKAVGPIIRSRPLGPSLRDYANSAILVRTRLTPSEMLDRLQAIEKRFGRRRSRRWGSRTLDLDILLWDGGMVRTPRLAIPHPACNHRDFVLGPLNAIASKWRDARTGLRIVHSARRLNKPKPVDPTPPRR